jgi:hypothetical protein
MTTHHIQSPLWDSATTAAFLNIPVRTLDQWSYRGIGPSFFKVGRHRRYTATEVQAWLESTRHGGHAA